MSDTPRIGRLLRLSTPLPADDVKALHDLLNGYERELAAARAENEELRKANEQLFSHGESMFADRDRLAAELATARKAIEFAEYLAKGAEQFLEAANTFAASSELSDNTAACDSYSDHFKGLQNDIYEFRKRAALAQVKEPRDG